MAGFRNIFRAPEAPDAGAVLDDSRFDEFMRDPAVASLAEELGALASVPVPPSARQRGLSLVHEEFDRQERRGVLGVARGNGLLFRGRLALGAVAVALAAFLGLVGLYGGGGTQQWAGSTDTGSPSTGPVTSGPDGSGSTATSERIPHPTITSAIGTTVPDGTTVPTSAPTTVPGSTVTDPPSTTGSTLRPPSTTATSRPADTTTLTTGHAVLTREQREGSARSVAMYLSEKVVLHDPDSAAAVLAGSAGPGFVQLVSSLEAPYAYAVVSVATTDGPSTRVLVEFLDRVPRDDGVEEVSARFYYEMRVDASGALVTAIYKAPAQ